MTTIRYMRTLVDQREAVNDKPEYFATKREAWDAAARLQRTSASVRYDVHEQEVDDKGTVVVERTVQRD